MALKTCAYKDCDNYVLNGARQGDYCMFSFPKEPKRREEWMQFGMVNRRIPPEHLYMCSEHFEDKYIAKSPRRWNLVSTAKPKPFQTQTDETYTVDYTDLMSKAELETSVPEEEAVDDPAEILMNNDNKNYVVESTVPESDEDHNVYETIEFLDSSFKGAQDETILYKKRKYDSEETAQEHRTSSLKILNFHVDQQQRLQPKAIKTTSLLSVKTIEPIVNRPDEMTQSSSVDSALLDSNEVSVFIFKGEEYVQMSKEYYFREKLDLLKKLRIYENSFKKIKQNVDSVCTNITK